MVTLAWAWEIERPGDDFNIKERTENAYSNGEASVGLGVGIDDYDEGASEYGGDYVALNVSMTANSRKGITYNCDSESLWWISEDELWYRSDRVGAGDDVVIPADISQYKDFAFRFYGGFLSAEYQEVYISTNGFISFHSSTQPSPSPANIPASAEPNAIIAAVWTDLNIDSSASIITGLWTISSRWYFVIIWNNALHKASGQRHTFQIILENAPGYYPTDTRYSQSRIWISYKSVSSINTDFAYGIEDQEGCKGLGDLSSGSSLGYLNETTLRFYQYLNSFFLKRLTINLADTNTQTKINILDNLGCVELLRGHNVRLKSTPPPEPDENLMFYKALGGWATLLLGGKAGIIVGIVFTAWDTLEYLAHRQYSTVEYSKLVNWAQEVYIEAPTYDYVVDATLSIVVHWVLYTPNDGPDHTLTITANLEYYEYSILDGSIIDKPPITTSVNLKIVPDDNNDFGKARLISFGTYTRLYIGVYDESNYYQIKLKKGDKIEVYGEATSSPDKPDFYLFLYDPGKGEPKASSDHGYYPSLSYTADSPGYWFIEARKHENHGFYSLKVTPGPGGCPYVSTWDRTRWWLDNNLIPAAEHSNGADVIDYYKLQQPLLSHGDGIYRLLLSEFEQEHDFFDQVRLLAVDHQSDAGVAVSPYGEILTYTDPSPPASAIDGNNRNMKHLLNAIDGDYYEGYNGSYITLNFGDELDVSNGARLVMRADTPPMKESIHVQVQDEDDNWNTVATVIPRVYWATEIIDLSEHLPDAKGNLKVRLYFTASHKVDFVGLDTSPQATTHIHEGQLISAIHSTDGDVTAKLLFSDETYAELVSEQQIELRLTLPPQTMEDRDYIIITEGHYYTIKT